MIPEATFKEMAATINQLLIDNRDRVYTKVPIQYGILDPIAKNDFVLHLNGVSYYVNYEDMSVHYLIIDKNWSLDFRVFRF